MKAPTTPAIPAPPTPDADESSGGELGQLLGEAQRAELATALQSVIVQFQKQARDAWEPQLEALRQQVQARLPEVTDRLRAAIAAAQDTLLGAPHPGAGAAPATPRPASGEPVTRPTPRRPASPSRGMWQSPLFRLAAPPLGNPGRLGLPTRRRRPK